MIAEAAGPVPARPAATIALLRDDPDLEVLMVRRAAGASFMAGAWVFPGGLVDEVDHGASATRLVADSPAALRPVVAASRCHGMPYAINRPELVSRT